MKMLLKIAILASTLVTTSAYPLRRSSREATWIDSKANEAQEEAGLAKDVDQIYKTHIDSSDLYNQGRHANNPMAEEMQQKLNMESERLRARLRQELAELQERLSSSPAHLSSTLASMRQRLAPLTQQLQSSVSDNIRDLCKQLSLHLQGLETAQVQPRAGPALYQEAFEGMSRTLELSSSKVAEIISDFQAELTGVVKHLGESSAGEQEAAELRHEVSFRLGQEVSSLRVEAQGRVEALRAELAALLQTAQPRKSELAASKDWFCQNASAQSQMYQNRVERLFQGLEEEQGERGASLSSSSSSIQPGGSLQEDFTVKFSALLQDILHSV